MYLCPALPTLGITMISDASISPGPSAEVTSHVRDVNETLLNCSICNFYPKEIDATWNRDGENWDQDRGDTIRNWDGTYCTWISIDINSMEEDHYRCYVEHEGLQEALSVKYSKPQKEGNLSKINSTLTVPIGEPIVVLFY